MKMLHMNPFHLVKWTECYTLNSNLTNYKFNVIANFKETSSIFLLGILAIYLFVLVFFFDIFFFKAYSNVYNIHTYYMDI